MWLDESSDFGLPWGIAGTSLMRGFSFATHPSSLFYTLFFTHTKKNLPLPPLMRSLFGFIFLFSSSPQMHIIYSLLTLPLTTHLLFISFLLQGLRKTSDCGRTKRTIMPHSVPHMVQLRKFIVSEDTVFLLLQYAEGKTHTSNAHQFHLSSFVFFTSNCLFPSFTGSLCHSSPTSLCPCSRQMFDRDGCVSQVIILNTRWRHASLAMPTPGPPYIPLTLGCVCSSCVLVSAYNEMQPYF